MAAWTGGEVTHTGVVKSFGPNKGFGFIKSNEVPTDVYFQIRDLPPSYQHVDASVFKLEGCTVTFSLIHSADGKPQAKCVQPIAASEHEATPNFVGEIKSFSESKGFGFISSESQDMDVYFQKKDIPAQLQREAIAGAQVAFSTLKLPDGKVQARKLHFIAMHSTLLPKIIKATKAPGGLSSLLSAIVGPGACLNDANLGVYARTVQDFEQSPLFNAVIGPTEGCSLAGTVKKFDYTRKHGFIACPDVKDDIFFKCADDFPPQPGTAVSFNVKWAKDGKPFATDVKPPLEEGAIAAGIIKSYSVRSGYGFIKADTNTQDVYFQRASLPVELQACNVVGAQVQFTVGPTVQGKPQARDVVIMQMQGVVNSAVAPVSAGAGGEDAVWAMPAAMPAGMPVVMQAGMPAALPVQTGEQQLAWFGAGDEQAAKRQRIMEFDPAQIAQAAQAAAVASQAAAAAWTATTAAAAPDWNNWV